MQPDLQWRQLRQAGLLAHLPNAWRMPLARLALAWLGIFALTAREWGQMAHQWWDIDTYNHILLVPLLVIWLISLRVKGLRQLNPQHWTPGLGLVLAGLTLWLIGRASGINLIAQAGAVGALQASLIAFLGLRVVTYLLLPAAMLTFLVPFGDEIIPFLQSITAEIAIKLTMWSGVEAVYEDIYIHTPVGLFIVAEECSGVKFLIAMVTLGVLVAFTSFATWKRRMAFMAACLIVPIIANGIRAWGTIFIAQSKGVEFAAGFDHIVYGWVFFAIVMAIVIGGALPFFDREPENAGYSAAEVKTMGWLDTLSALQNFAKGKLNASGNQTLLIALALMLGFALAAIYASAPIG